jgi:hypothetical protein
MQKITQKEYDEFKLRVINAVMKEYRDLENCKNGHTDINPLVFLKAFNFNHKIAPLPPQLFDSQELKEIAARTICDMVKVAESPVMCFVTEGLMAKLPKGVDPSNLPKPSELPEDQRQEIVFLHFESRNLGDYSISFIKKLEYINGGSKFKVKLVPDENLKGLNQANNKNTSIKGIFSNFYSAV